MNQLSRLLRSAAAGSVTAAVESIMYGRISLCLACPARQDILDIVAKLPLARDKDRVEVSIEIDETPGALNSSCLVQDAAKFIDEYNDEMERVCVSWSVYKAPELGKANIYSIVAFENHISEEGGEKFLESIGNLMGATLWIETDEEEAFCRTESIYFCSENILVHDRNCLSWSRDNIHQGFRDNCDSSVPIGKTNPIDFYLVDPPTSPAVKDLFDELFKLTFLVHICDRLALNEDRSIGYEVQGYRLIKENSALLEDFYVEPGYAYQIFSWTYCGGGVSDKIGLLRNVISLESHKNGKLRTDGNLWAAIRSNYEIYLKKNVQQYIEVKNKVADLIFDYAERFSEYSRQFLGSFQGAVILLLSSLISMFFLNGISSLGAQGFFSWATFSLLLSVSVIIWLWLYASYNNLVSNFDNADIVIQRAIKNNYAAILVQDEIDSLLGEFIRSNREHVIRQAGKYVWVWGAAPAILLIVLLASILFKSLPHSDDENGVVLAFVPRVFVGYFPIDYEASRFWGRG